MLLARMMAVYGMQSVVLGVNGTGDAIGKIEAEVQGSEFKKNTLIPLVKMFTNVMNSGLVWNDSNLNYDDIYLTSENLDIDDEKKQAEIDEAYLDRGVITINQVRNRLQMPPVEWGYMPFVPLNYAPYDTLVKYQQSKIESNIKRAMSDGIDNNVNTPEGNEEANKEIYDGGIDQADMTGLYTALYESSKDPSEVYRHSEVMKEGKLLTGLEKVEPSIVKEVINNMMKERETKNHTPMSYGDVSQGKLFSTVDRFGLKWGNIL
jgi:hypothetical protein